MSAERDVVERLRELSGHPDSRVANEAADEIERLRRICVFHYQAEARDICAWLKEAEANGCATPEAKAEYVNARVREAAVRTPW